MQEQRPIQKLKVFRAFEGYAEHIYMTNTAKQLNPYYAIDFRNDKNALVNMRMTTDNMSGSKFKNSGSLGGTISLKGTKHIEDVFFQIPSEGGNVVGTLYDTASIFDGIACNDKHMTTKLMDEDSYIQFMTPVLDEWSPANTIEFWFKLADPADYNRDALIFSMVSNDNNPQDYYHVYIEGGVLKCAPFGNGFYKDPIIAFSDFNLANEDTYGWWHISCSYNFQ